jgi:hypothetical protein
MKQYNKVYVPDFNGGISVVERHRGRNIHLDDVKIVNQVVVLSPEQFKTALLFVIQQGHGIGWDSLPELVDNYLTSKGITI